MDLNKGFDAISWTDLIIEQDELKSIREFAVKDLKHRDLHLEHDIQSDIIALINRKK